MQNFSHAWITFAQSLSLLRPVDFLSELLPKAGQLRKHIHFLVFFFVFFRAGQGWVVMLWAPRLLWEHQIFWITLPPTHPDVICPENKVCPYRLTSSDLPNPPLTVSPLLSDPINSTFTFDPAPNLPPPSLRGAERISKIEQSVAGIETHLLSSDTEIDF